MLSPGNGAPILLVLAAFWTLSAVAWRWTARRLDVSGPPPPALGPREARVRRTLRALLAFDFLVVFPLALPLLLGLALHAGPGRLEVALAMTPGVVTFALAIPALARRARALRARRAAGRGEAGDPASLWVDGPPAMIAAAKTVGDPLAKLAITFVWLAGGAFAYGALAGGGRPVLAAFVLFACAVAVNEVSESRRG